MITSKKIVF